MSTRFATAADGMRIAYDVGGSGPALVLLHGAGKLRDDWHKAGYVQRLEKDFTVITLDIRGNGESDRGFEVADYAIERICDDVFAVGDAAGIGDFAVWGFSFGGNIARYLGAWSERVTAIVVGGVPFGPAVDDSFERYIQTLEKKWGARVEAYRAGTLSDKERKALLKSQTAVWLPCFQAMRQWPSIEPTDVKCPSMLVVGTKNKAVLSWAEANQAALDEADVQLEVVEGLNHGQEFSHIDRVFPVVHEFLAGQMLT